MNTIYLVKNRYWKQLPPVLCKTVVKHLADLYSFGGPKGRSPLFAVKLVDPASLPRSIDFTDAVLYYYPSVSEGLAHHKAELIKEIQYVSNIHPDIDFKQMLTHIKNTRSSVLEGGRFIGSKQNFSGTAVAIGSCAVFVSRFARNVLGPVESETFKRKPQELNKRSLKQLAKALAGAGAHEVRHQLLLPHAKTGLGAAAASSSGGFSKRDKQEIRIQIQWLRQEQGKLRTVPVRPGKPKSSQSGKVGKLNVLGPLLASANKSFVPVGYRRGAGKPSISAPGGPSSDIGGGGRIGSIGSSIRSQYRPKPKRQPIRVPGAGGIGSPGGVGSGIGGGGRIGSIGSSIRSQYRPKPKRQPIRVPGAGGIGSPGGVGSGIGGSLGSPQANMHIVKEKEVLSRIARRHGTTVGTLAELNPWLLGRQGRKLKGVDYILPGDRIRLPGHNAIHNVGDFPSPRRPGSGPSTLSNIAKGLR